jgi:hypothetical protein
MRLRGLAGDQDATPGRVRSWLAADNRALTQGEAADLPGFIGSSRRTYGFLRQDQFLQDFDLWRRLRGLGVRPQILAEVQRLLSDDVYMDFIGRVLASGGSPNRQARAIEAVVAVSIVTRLQHTFQHYGEVSAATGLTAEAGMLEIIGPLVGSFTAQYAQASTIKRNALVDALIEGHDPCLNARFNDILNWLGIVTTGINPNELADQAYNPQITGVIYQIMARIDGLGQPITLQNVIAAITPQDGITPADVTGPNYAAALQAFNF